MNKTVTIIVARKPLSEPSIVENIQKWGCGAINIEASRINTQDSLHGGAYAESPTPRAGKDLWTSNRKGDTQCFKRGGAGDYVQPPGRWPANLILEHLPECQNLGTKRVKPMGGSGRAGPGGHGFQDQYVGGEKSRDGFAGGVVGDDGLEEVDDWQCVDGCVARDLGEQSGNLISTGGQHSGTKGTRHVGSFGHKRVLINRPTDEGTAARFFKQIKGGSDES